MTIFFVDSFSTNRIIEKSDFVQFNNVLFSTTFLKHSMVSYVTAFNRNTLEPANWFMLLLKSVKHFK